MMRNTPFTFLPLALVLALTAGTSACDRADGPATEAPDVGAATVVGGGGVATLDVDEGRATLDGAVRIEGDVPSPYTLTAEIFRSFPSEEIIGADHGGEAVRFRGVDMRHILERAGVELGATLRGGRMATYLLVEAADGYRAVFALPELDEAFGRGGVYLVDQADGVALDAEQGPFRIVVPEETRHARWVRMVTALSVRSVD